MNKTKIEWADSTWNPVTGCLHNCEYCYARKISRRFCHDPWNTVEDGITHFVGLPMQNEFYKGNRIDPYPYGFDPTFHRYRLDEPQGMKKPQNIFVCSMADLFGDWVPDTWIEKVFKACEAAPQHRYLFLTKNWMRACEYQYRENWWIGRTITHDAPSENNTKNLHLCYGVPKSAESALSDHPNRFISIEPIQSDIPDLPYYAHDYGYKWVIVGAETGNRKGKIIPKREWIEKIIDDCTLRKIPLFMKESLRQLMGEDFIQEFPQGLAKEASDD